MRISLNWLKDYVDIDVDVDTLARQMTMLGLEIEAIERPGEEINDVYVGQIVSIDPHPDADKLVVCKTDVGREEPAQIVCGAKNMKVGDKVPTAVVGATLPGDFKIGRRKMRGVESRGMMCSARELGLGEDHSGLLILDPDAPVGHDVRPLLGLDDVVLEIEVTPNRGDTASMIGVARELAALYGRELRLPERKLEEAGPAAGEMASVTIEDPECCPRYLGRVLTDVKIGPSPAWLCRRLIAAGQRPINNVVDITNFVLLETGHPLHAFDFDKLAEHRIVVRHPRPGETMRTLDDVERTLQEDMLVIADGVAPQAIAGIMGGGDSEVGEGTTRVFLESAVFKPASVRSTSRALGLASESSQRFQRGADPNMAAFALDRAADLMAGLAGATIAPGVLDEHPRPLVFPKVTLRYARCDQLMGVDIPPEEQRKSLEKLGFTVVAQDGASCTVQVPTWRPDVSIEADLIEEVGRSYNYDNITATLPSVRPQEKDFAPTDRPVRQLRRFLAHIGLSETVHWTFSSPADVARAGLPEEYGNMAKLENPLSEKQATMQSSLIPSLLNTAAHNLNRGADRIALFEIGPVYIPRAPGELPEQRLRLTILLGGLAQRRHWDQAPRPVDFHDLKGFLEAVMEHLGVEYTLQEGRFSTLQTGLCADIYRQKTPIGTLGRVKNKVLREFDMEQALYLLDVDLEYLVGLEKMVPTFSGIPAFPPSLRDMAVVVNSDVKAGELLKTAKRFGGKLLKTVELFDIYTGNPVPEGQKSMALGLTFQSPERTLTDKDTQKSWDKILKALKREHGAVLR